MEEVCKQLDSVLLEVMSSLQELSRLRERYSAAVKEGYITMAQARHAMGGPTSVSSLQYDAVMAPLVSIDVSSEAKAYDELLAEVDSGSDWAEFKVNRVVPGKPVRKSRLSESDESADIIGGGGGGGGSGLRQRKRSGEVKDPMAYEMKQLDVDDVTKVMTSLKLKDPDKGNKGTFESNEQLKDPIKWFGVLVPQTLRQSQKHFVTAIECAGELAGAQLKVEALRRRYRELLAKKERLKKQQESC